MPDETIEITDMGRVEVILKQSNPAYVAERLCDLMPRSEAIRFCEERNRPDLVRAILNYVPTKGDA
jgi:hypothetical protein